MESNAERPEARALAELENVIGHVAEELAAWRRRALKAEGQRQDPSAPPDLVSARERVLELEHDNTDLVGRLQAARERLERLAQRLQFLEEQVGAEEELR